MRNRSEKLKGNAAALHHADGRWAGVYFCTKCRMTCRSQEAAETCCLSIKCRDCGDEHEGRGNLICRPCRHQQSEERATARWDAVEKVPVSEASEYVVIDGDEGITLLEEAIEMMEEGEANRVYCCDVEKLSFDGEGIIGNALGDWFDGAQDRIGNEARVQLQALLDGWCDAHGITQWVQNDRKGVVL